ncbi:MAG: Gfo/Idh/MocA family protein [Thermoguttaceae bacterium]
MKSDLSRRRFLAAAAATGAAAATIVPRHVLGGPGTVPPSEKVTLAHIGIGTQSIRELDYLLNEPRIQIVAVCDPNRESSDYVEWGKGGIRNTIRQYLGEPNWHASDDGCPGGRDVGKLIVDTYYAKQRSIDRFKACTAYTDFRELLDKEKDLDAVKVMTPDHLHATVSIAAMKRGLHVMMHKPLANRMAEGRMVVETARATKVATHLLAYGSGGGNRLIAEAIGKGILGKLREIHNWTNRPVWPQYTEIPTDKPPVPAGLDWDLWLGPALDRPYSPQYTHTVFRGWYDFGGGSMADMGIYSLWPVFETLGLGVPTSAQAWATHTCKIESGVSRTVSNDFSYPTGCTIRLEFAATADRPELDLFWYDGGMKPRLPKEVEAHDVPMEREGILFVGDDGSILAGFHGQDPQRFSGGKREPLSLAESEATRAQRQVGWVDEICGGGRSPGSFLHAASITDAVNLGSVALRAGKRVVFDSQAMKITSDASANRYLVREYRKGWELG